MFTLDEKIVNWLEKANKQHCWEIEKIYGVLFFNTMIIPKTQLHALKKYSNFSHLFLSGDLIEVPCNKTTVYLVRSLSSVEEALQEVYKDIKVVWCSVGSFGSKKEPYPFFKTLEEENRFFSLSPKEQIRYYLNVKANGSIQAEELLRKQYRI